MWLCEGIEKPEQLAFMRTLGCEAIQGYFLARPMPAEAATVWLGLYRAGDPELTAWFPPRPRRGPSSFIHLYSPLTLDSSGGGSLRAH